MRISDWSSDVCSSDLAQAVVSSAAAQQVVAGEAEHQIVPAAAFQGLRRRRAENGVVAGLGDLLAIERVGVDVVHLHLRAIGGGARPAGNALDTEIEDQVHGTVYVRGSRGLGHPHASEGPHDNSRPPQKEIERAPSREKEGTY